MYSVLNRAEGSIAHCMCYFLFVVVVLCLAHCWLGCHGGAIVYWYRFVVYGDL